MYAINTAVIGSSGGKYLLLLRLYSFSPFLVQVQAKKVALYELQAQELTLGFEGCEFKGVADSRKLFMPCTMYSAAVRQPILVGQQPCSVHTALQAHAHNTRHE